jgi:hypothetical protein
VGELGFDQRSEEGLATEQGMVGSKGIGVEQTSTSLMRKVRVNKTFL